jgi:HNH endonuclease
MGKRRPIPPSVRDEVLREAGYKCANPTCRNILTLQLHHIVWVKEGGGSSAHNLVALCGHCHDMHTQGHVPRSAIRYWKGMLHALNHAFSKESMDLLLFLHQRGASPHWYSADGVLRFAGLFAAGLVQFGEQNVQETFVSFYESRHQVVLSEKGALLVEAWKSGDEERYKAILEQGESAALPESSPPYTFFILNSDMELNRNWQSFV